MYNEVYAYKLKITYKTRDADSTPLYTHNTDKLALALSNFTTHRSVRDAEK